MAAHSALKASKTQLGKKVRGWQKWQMPPRESARTYWVEDSAGGTPRRVEVVDAKELQRMTGGRWRRCSLTRIVKEERESPGRWKSATGLDGGYIVRDRRSRPHGNVHFTVATMDHLRGICARYTKPLTGVAMSVGLNPTELHGSRRSYLDRFKISGKWYTTGAQWEELKNQRGVLHRSYSRIAASKVLGVSLKTAHLWLKDGSLPKVIDGVLARADRDFIDSNAAAIRADPRGWHSRRLRDINPQGSGILKRAEAARVLGIPSPTLLGWMRKGIVPSVRTGNHMGVLAPFVQQHANAIRADKQGWLNARRADMRGAAKAPEMMRDISAEDNRLPRLREELKAARVGSRYNGSAPRSEEEILSELGPIQNRLLSKGRGRPGGA